MLLALHILVAIASVAYSSFIFFKPSEDGLKITYWLMFATLSSGTYLVIVSHARLVESCVSGILFVSIVSIGIVRATRKLAEVKKRINH